MSTPIGHSGEAWPESLATLPEHSTTPFERQLMATANNLSFSLSGPPGTQPPYLLVGGSHVDVDYHKHNQ